MAETPFFILTEIKEYFLTDIYLNGINFQEVVIVFIIIPERIDKDENIEFEEILEKATIIHVECENPNGTIALEWRTRSGKHINVFAIRCLRCKSYCTVLQTNQRNIDIVKTAIDGKERILEEGELMTKGKVS